MTEQTRAHLLKLIKKETGADILKSGYAMEPLVGYLAEIVPPEILELAEQKVDLFFTFSQRESGVDFDGKAIWTTEAKTGRTYSAIGISEEAIAEGRDYAVMVWLHELSHILTKDDHTELFHSMLDQLLIVTNGESGTDIKNDYFGLAPSLLP